MGTQIRPTAWLLAMLLLPCATAQAAEPVAPKETEPAVATPAGPVKVKVGLYMLNVGKFELATGTFTVDFYLQLTADRDMGDQRFEFMNGRGSIDKVIDTPQEKFYRIQANLMTNVDLRRYPWDGHQLPVVIEHASRGNKEVVYEVDQSTTGIDPEVRIVGWELETYTAQVRQHDYPVYKETYSQFVYTISIGRLIMASSLKNFLPVLVFLIITLISLLIATEKTDSRITMNTALLIAAVMFHLSIQSALPPVGYITLADKVMIATYAVTGANLSIAVIMLRQLLGKADEKANKTRRQAFVIVPAVAILSYLAAFVL